MQRISTLLIGGSSDNKNNFSKLLLGRVRDKDKDSAITGFSKWVDDCEPNNKRKQGPLEDAQIQQKTNITRITGQIESMGQRMTELSKMLNTGRDSGGNVIKDASGYQNELTNLTNRQQILNAELQGWQEGGQAYADYYSSKVNAEQQGREQAEQLIQQIAKQEGVSIQQAQQYLHQGYIPNKKITNQQTSQQVQQQNERLGIPAGYYSKELQNLLDKQPTLKGETQYQKIQRVYQDPDYIRQANLIKDSITQGQIKSSLPYQQEQRTRQYLSSIPTETINSRGYITSQQIQESQQPNKFSSIETNKNEPVTGYKPSWWYNTQTTISKYLKRFSNPLEYEPEEQRLSLVTTYTSPGMGMGLSSRGTLSYRGRTPEELPPTQAYETRLNLELSKISGNLNDKVKELQDKINSGEITYETATMEYKKYEESKKQELEDKNKALIKLFEIEKSKADIPLNIVKGAGIGVLSVFAPPVAWTLIGLDTSKTTFNPEVSTGQKLSSITTLIGAGVGGTIGAGLIFGGIAGSIVTSPNPLATGISSASFGIGAMGGGYGAGKIKQIIKNTQIQQAIENAKVQIDSIGILNERTLANLDLTKSQKIEITKLIQQGGSVKVYETKLIPDPKFIENTPKVSGKFIEILSQSGKVIDRIAVGELKATLNGKTIERTALNQALLLINEEAGGIKGYSELLLAQKTNKPKSTGTLSILKVKETGMKGTKYNFFEESKQVGEQRINKKTRVVTTESSTELLGKSKWKGEKLLEGYGKDESGVYTLPNLDNLKGEKFSKSRFSEIQTLQDEKGTINFFTDTRQGVGALWQRFITKGKGIVELIKEEKKVKPSKSWETKQESSTIAKVVESKQVKLKKVKPFEEKTPSYLGGEGQGTTSDYAYVFGDLERVKGGMKVNRWEAARGEGGGNIMSAFSQELPVEFSKGIAFNSLIQAGGMGTSLGVNNALKTGNIELNINKSFNRERNLPGLNLLNVNALEVSPREDISIKQKQPQAQKTNQKQELQQRTFQKTTTISTPTGFFFPFETVTPTEIPPETRKKRKEYGEQAYDSYALIDSTKPGKRRWIQVADNVDRETALSIGGGFVDMSSLSSRFKIVKDEGEVNENVKSSAWGNIAKKFRNYMVKKGTKIQQSNQYIEKTKFRLDSSQEKRKIKQARVSSLLIGR